MDIFNSQDIHVVLHQITLGSYDFVHCHNERFVLDCVAHLQVPFAVSSHTAVSKLPSGNYGYLGATEYLFKNTLYAPANIVLSDEIKTIYESTGYRGLLRVLPNAVEIEKYRVADQGNGKPRRLPPPTELLPRSFNHPHPSILPTPGGHLDGTITGVYAGDKLAFSIHCYRACSLQTSQRRAYQAR